MKKFYLLFPLLFFFSFILFSCEGTTESTTSANYEKVYNVVDSVRQSLQSMLGISVPSLNVLITTPSEEIFVSAVPQNGTPITKNSYFRFASNTKNFTAASILNMQEDGWLDISQKITDTIPGSVQTYVPSTPAWNIPYKNQITIKQVLQHSAGIYDVSNDTVPGCGGESYNIYMELLDPNHQFSAEELVNAAAVNNLSYFSPGTAHHYTNTGYVLLSEIIARVYSQHAGTPKLYSDYIYDYLTGNSAAVPLGVKFPHLASDNQLPEPNVPGTTYYKDNTVVTTSAGNKSGNIGEGNGYGTMSMLGTYVRTMITGANALSPATINLMKNELSPGNQYYGLGCAIYPNLGYGHTGATRGYFSCMFYDPQTGVSVVGMIPLWDLRNDNTSFYACFFSVIDACYSARTVLGFPGKPVTGINNKK